MIKTVHLAISVLAFLLSTSNALSHMSKFIQVIDDKKIDPRNMYNEADTQTVHGFVLVYAQKHLTDAFKISAQVSLPEKSQNRSWYTCWLMILPKDSSKGTPYVQVGLMRRPPNGSILRAFVAAKLRNSSDYYYSDSAETISRNNFAKAVAEIDVSQKFIILKIDGHSLLRLSTSKYFSHSAYSSLYGQLGSELSAVGDTVSGSINNITIVNSGDSKANFYEPYCGFSSAGLHLSRNLDEFIATGSLSTKGTGSFINLLTMTQQQC